MLGRSIAKQSQKQRYATMDKIAKLFDWTRFHLETYATYNQFPGRGMDTHIPFLYGDVLIHFQDFDSKNRCHFCTFGFTTGQISSIIGHLYSMNFLEIVCMATFLHALIHILQIL